MRPRENGRTSAALASAFADAMADGDICGVECLFCENITQLLEAEDIGRGDRGGSAVENTGGKMIECTDAAACDDWNRHTVCDVAYEVDIIARSHAIAVDRIEKKFSGAAGSCFYGPIACEFSGRPAAAIDDHFVGTVDQSLGVDRDDDGLCAVTVCSFRDEMRRVERRGVDHDAVGSRLKMTMYGLDRANSATNGEGRKTVSPDLGQDIKQSPPAWGAMHVEIDDLVDIPRLIALELSKGITQPVMTSKLLAAINGAIVEQQNGNNSMIEHYAFIGSRLAVYREAQIRGAMSRQPGRSFGSNNPEHSVPIPDDFGHRMSVGGPSEVLQ
jgi:hypothetical protein